MKARVPSVEQKVNALDAKYNSKLDFWNGAKKAFRYAVVGGFALAAVASAGSVAKLSRDLINNYVDGNESAVAIVQNYNPSSMIGAFAGFAIAGTSVIGRRYSDKRIGSLEVKYDKELEKLVNAKEIK